MHCLHCATPLPSGSRFCPTCGADSSDPGSGPKTDPGSFSNLIVRLRAAVGDRYELTESIGRGGMGAVYLATERKLDRPVAIKVLPLDVAHDEQVLFRFLREARMAAKLDHPNIIPIYAVEDENDLHYFVMKYITGRSLSDELAGTALPIDQTQRLLWESASALQHAHERGVVHRDVKPSNIMIDDRGRAILTDFGISKALEASTQFTATGQVIGTPSYMSPEQAKGQAVDGRSDQYSTAVVGYRMLTGRLPFEDEAVHTVLYKHIFEDPPRIQDLRPEVPDFLADALNRGMSKDPADRFPTMAQFGHAVWPEKSHVTMPPSGERVAVITDESKTEITPPAWWRKRRRGLTAIVSTVVLVGAVGTWLITRGSRSDVPVPAEAGAEVAGAAAPVDDTADGLAARGPDSTPSRVVPGVATEAANPAVEPAPTGTPVGQSTQSPPTQPTQPATSQAPAVGFLTVGAQPWGTVLIDGVEIRNTPLTRHELPPGRYVIEIRRLGYQTTVDTVTITASNATILRKVLMRGPG